MAAEFPSAETIPSDPSGTHPEIDLLDRMIPLVFAAAAWCAVGGNQARNRNAQIGALVLPLVAIGLSTVDPSRDYVYGEFLKRYQSVLLARPPLVTIATAAACYAGFWACRVRTSAVLFMAMLLWASVVGPDSPSAFQFGPISLYPILAAALVSSLRGIYRRDPFWAGCAVACWSLSAMLAATRLSGAPVAFIGFHTVLILAVAAAIGLGRERGRPFGLFAALLVAVAGLHALQRSGRLLFEGLPPVVADWYSLAVVLLATPYAWGTRDLAMGSAAAGVATGAAARWSVHLYALLKQYVRGLDFIALGLGCFAVALGVSYLKARQREASKERPASESSA